MNTHPYPSIETSDTRKIIYNYLLENGISRLELSEKIDTGKATISSLLNGDRPLTNSVCVKLSEYNPKIFHFSKMIKEVELEKEIVKKYRKQRIEQRGYGSTLFLPNRLNLDLERVKRNVIKDLNEFRESGGITTAKISKLVGYQRATVSGYLQHPEDTSALFIFTVIRCIDYPFSIDPSLIKEVKEWESLVKYVDTAALRRGIKFFIFKHELNQRVMCIKIGIDETSFSRFLNGEIDVSEKLFYGLLGIDKDYFSQFMKGKEMFKTENQTTGPVAKVNYENSPFRQRVSRFLCIQNISMEELAILIEMPIEKLKAVMNFHEPLTPEFINVFSDFDQKSFPPDLILEEYFTEVAQTDMLNTPTTEEIVFKDTPIRNRLKEYMKKNNLDYKGLAKRFKYSNAYVKQILTGSSPITEPFLLSIVSLDSSLFPEKELRNLWGEEKVKLVEEYRNMGENKPAEIPHEVNPVQNITYNLEKRLIDNKFNILNGLNAAIRQSSYSIRFVAEQMCETESRVLYLISHPDEVKASFLQTAVSNVSYAFDIDLELYRDVIFQIPGFEKRWPLENKIIYKRALEYLKTYGKTYKDLSQKIGLDPISFLESLFNSNPLTDTFYRHLIANEGEFFKNEIPQQIKEKFPLHFSHLPPRDDFYTRFQQRTAEQSPNADPMYHAAIGVVLAALDKAQQLNPSTTDIGQIEKIVQHPLVKHWICERIFKQ